MIIQPEKDCAYFKRTECQIWFFFIAQLMYSLYRFKRESLLSVLLSNGDITNANVAFTIIPLYFVRFCYSLKAEEWRLTLAVTYANKPPCHLSAHRNTKIHCKHRAFIYIYISLLFWWHVLPYSIDQSHDTNQLEIMFES